MSWEFIALLQEQPAVRPTLERSTTLRSASLEISDHDGATHLYDRSGRLLVHIGQPLKVEVQGEVERLLGETLPPPIWWTEINATISPANAVQIARHCAEALISHHGGLIWNARQ